MSKKITVKVKGFHCQINEDDKEISCRHYRHCNNCCGLKICECNNKLTMSYND